jgi:hypothetical protein
MYDLNKNFGVMYAWLSCPTQMEIIVACGLVTSVAKYVDLHN